jgi:hypothetical protein
VELRREKRTIRRESERNEEEGREKNLLEKAKNQ